jgi:hypothetical protein
MKYFRLPEFGSEFEVIKDLKLRVVFPKDFNCYKNVQTAEEELSDLELPKGSIIKFASVSDRFSPYILTKGVRFTKLANKVSKGKKSFILPFNLLHELKNIKMADISERIEVVEKEKPNKIKDFRILGLQFYINLDPNGGRYEKIHENCGILESSTIYKLATTLVVFTGNTKRENKHETPCEFSMNVSIKKKTFMVGNGFEAKPVRETRIFMSNPRVKILGKTFDLTASNFQGRVNKDLNAFLITSIDKKLI